MKRTALVLSLVCLMHVHAAAQSVNAVNVELDQTIGHSTEDVSAAGTQLHLFGEAMAGIRFGADAAWATRSADRGDAFDTSYPYAKRLQLIEAYGERLFDPGHGLLALRVGRYRTPFGIYSASDHAYMGFLRAPLIRYESYFGLSNNFLEQGADVVVGIPRVSVETSIGVPSDVGEDVRRSGVDAVVRGQGQFGALIVGMSAIRTQPNLPATFAHGYMSFTGVDARWMHAGLQLRGEWIWGQPFDGTETHGGYADLIVHPPSMGLFTVVARAERLSYVAIPPFDMYAHRFTAGTRIRLFDRLSSEIELVQQSHAVSAKPLAVNVGLTYSVRHDSRR